MTSPSETPSNQTNAQTNAPVNAQDAAALAENLLQTPQPEAERRFSREDLRTLARRYLRLFQRPQRVDGRFSARNFWQSVGFAFEGLLFAFRTQRNFRIDVFLSVSVIALGFVVRLDVWEWIPLVMMIGFVLFAETANTTVEWLVDLLTGGRYDIRAKRIKDVAAGACLIVALCGFAVGLLVFWPHLFPKW
ncbi:MAG: diacylglycerol kinase family protein [Candidatus Melainabacteria bacterium]|nr:diacylglycerol kinase family protein [Candidatus Melainabacteria bacterium]